MTAVSSAAIQRSVRWRTQDFSGIAPFPAGGAAMANGCAGLQAATYIYVSERHSSSLPRLVANDLSQTAAVSSSAGSKNDPHPVICAVIHERDSRRTIRQGPVIHRYADHAPADATGILDRDLVTGGRVPEGH